MHCYDCSLAGKERPAIGLCGSCSAGLCLEHANVRPRPISVPYPVATTIRLPLQARELLCSVCKMAIEQDRSFQRVA